DGDEIHRGKRYQRDALYLGSCDDGCLELADLLGWKDELLALRERHLKELDEAEAAHHHQSHTSLKITTDSGVERDVDVETAKGEAYVEAEAANAAAAAGGGSGGSEGGVGKGRSASAPISPVVIAAEAVAKVGPPAVPKMRNPIDIFADEIAGAFEDLHLNGKI
ncbi:hypothetical protein HK102_004691, partial [Quaeritorhiza haematococci]